MDTILQIENLNVRYSIKGGYVDAVNNANLTVCEGEHLGIIGESGSGKSSLAAALMRCKSVNREDTGKILYRGRDLLSMSDKEFDKFRWKEIAMVFQNSLDILNPVMPIGEQIGECVKKYLGLKQKDCDARVAEVLRQVSLEEDTAALLPHQLSGGMRQRVLIAMAISCKPRLLIADEPTSAVDEENKKEIMELLLRLRRELDLTLVIVSHEIQTVAASVNKVAVMYGGSIMEYASVKEIINHPRHSYTRGLLSSSPALNPYRDLWGIAEDDGSTIKEGCPFYGRCANRMDICQSAIPALQPLQESNEHLIACHAGGIQPILRISHVNKSFEDGKRTVCACNDCTFDVYYGEVVSVLGKSGAGKSTLASICSGMELPDSGEVTFMDQPLTPGTATARKHGIQIIIQDPFSSVNGRMTVFSAISEPLRICKETGNLEAVVAQMLRDVGLPTDKDFMNRACNTLSGGQRQRVSIARALSMEPRLLIADEICSMLDSSTQANLLRLLKGLQQRKGLTLIFVTHDAMISRKIADKVIRIDNGILTEVDDSVVSVNNPHDADSHDHSHNIQSKPLR